MVFINSGAIDGFVEMQCQHHCLSICCSTNSGLIVGLCESIYQFQFLSKFLASKSNDNVSSRDKLFHANLSDHSGQVTVIILSFAKSEFDSIFLRVR